MIYLYIIGLIVVVIFIYQQITSFDHWKKKGIKFIKPNPLVGNMKLSHKHSFVYTTQEWYSTYPEERYVGMYQFLTPTLLIRDPDLIKTITIKEFESFSEHRAFVSEDVDPLWSRHLFSMHSEKWRKMRPTLSPAFTSSKMRLMFHLMEDCAYQFVNYIKDQNQNIFKAEVKELCARYTNDVIATTAFGIKCDSLREKNNSFYEMGIKATDTSGLRFLPFFLSTISPTLMKILNLSILPKDCTNFFTNIIQNTLKARREQNIVRQDMINLLLEAQKGQLVDDSKQEIDIGFSTVQESEHGLKNKAGKITDLDIIAQALIFFLGGFESASTLGTFLIYEIAINADIQERLSKEVNQTWEKCDGVLTYEAILQMKYLDMIVSETLRKWPPGSLTDRKATRDFTIKAERAGEKPLLIENGTICMIPIYAIQRDPKYYPHPEKFDPERFSEENKLKINPCAYLPFGMGPRNCIASRFALLQNKILLFYIVKAFEIVTIEKTLIPLVLDPKNMRLGAKGGMWLGFKDRIN